MVQKGASNEPAVFHQARDAQRWTCVLDLSTVAWLSLRRCMEPSDETCMSAMATLTLMLMDLEEE